MQLTKSESELGWKDLEVGSTVVEPGEAHYSGIRSGLGLGAECALVQRRAFQLQPVLRKDCAVGLQCESHGLRLEHGNHRPPAVWISAHQREFQ